MADLNALIAQGPTIYRPDPLGQYAKMQQLQAGQQQMRTAGLQEQTAGMQLQQLKEDRANMAKLSQKLSVKGLSPRQFFEALQTSGDSKNQQLGIEGLMKLDETEKYDAILKIQQPIPAQQAPAPMAGDLGTGTFGMDNIPGMPNALAQRAAPMASTNALVPTPAAPKAADPVAAIDYQIALYENLKDSRAKDKVVRLQKQRDELTKLYPVGGNLVSGTGKKVFTADAAPTDVKKLIMERDALPPGSPNRALYDQQIKDLGATAQTARDRLAFDRQKFKWEKDNPGHDLVQGEGGEYFAVDKKTRAITPLMVAGGPAAPAGAGRGTIGVTDGGRTMIPLAGKAAGGTTEGERKAATLLQRLQFSQSQLTQALSDDPDAAKPGVFASAVAKLSTPLANTLTPEARQRVESAQLDMLDAALTLGTGAAYTREQLEGYRSAYFPSIGDGPNQVKDKKARLENVISAAQIAAGKAGKLVPNAPAIIPASVNNDRAAADKILGGQ